MTKGLVKTMMFVVIIFGIFYYIGYQNWLEEDFRDVDYSQYIEDEYEDKYESGESFQNNIANNSFDQSKAKLLYEQVNFKMIQDNFGEDFFDIYYGSESLPFSSKFIVYLSIVNLYKNDFMSNCYGTWEVSRDDVHSKAQEIFGDIEFDDVSFESGNRLLFIEYDSLNEYYIVTNKKCSGIDFGTSYIETEFIEGVVQDNYLEIYEHVYFVDYKIEDGGAYILNFYSSLDDEGELVATEVLNKKDKEKMPIYKIVFKIENDNYIFKDIQRIK